MCSEYINILFDLSHSRLSLYTFNIFLTLTGCLFTQNFFVLYIHVDIYIHDGAVDSVDVVNVVDVFAKDMLGSTAVHAEHPAVRNRNPTFEELGQLLRKGENHGDRKGSQMEPGP